MWEQTFTNQRLLEKCGETWVAKACVAHPDLLHCPSSLAGHWVQLTWGVHTGCSRVPEQLETPGPASRRLFAPSWGSCRLCTALWHGRSTTTGFSSAWEQKIPRAKLCTNILAFVMQTAAWGFSCTVVCVSCAFVAPWYDYQRGSKWACPPPPAATKPERS